jgi:excisionase family DNA binding protein
LDSRDSPFISAEEACLALGVKKSTLYAYVSRGKLRSYKKGMRRDRLYSRAELERLVGTDPTPATQSRSRIPRAEDWVAYV